MGAWSGFGITFRTMFRKTFTQGYPQKGEEKITAPRYHGRHQLNRWPDGLEKCVGCELCAWACPADAIYVEGGRFNVLVASVELMAGVINSNVEDISFLLPSKEDIEAVERYAKALRKRSE